ncbi:hypothetical protein BH09BAC2_BH09BAC2_04810 [soil metagenome]
MKPRTKKYYQNRSEQSGSKKGSVTEGGYNEQQPNTQTQDPKQNPGPSKTQDDPGADTLASQDDTGGSHSTGKRIDEN